MKSKTKKKKSRALKVKKKVGKVEKITDPIDYLKKLRRKKGKAYVTFLKGLQNRKLRGVDSLALALNAQAFKKIDCLDCANCCKKMSPTYNKADVKRISKHLGMTFQGFYDKYLEKDGKDYMNKSLPCQFLRKDNKCGIYTVRPRDCSGFPHTQFRDFKLYVAETHIQNIDYCPITMHVVEKMHEMVIEKGHKNLSAKMVE